ncbi:ciliary microtubule inner protein 2B isoform X3 [Rattus norvegicus]|uniref:ciliary microtubule inner protein 2B isoform X3 n=1 Tax=Rattus norvegicus TaxID=10116 RepID=UPI002FD81E0B
MAWQASSPASHLEASQDEGSYSPQPLPCSMCQHGTGPRETKKLLSVLVCWLGPSNPHPLPRPLPPAPYPWTRYTGPRVPPGREIERTASVPMAMVNTFIPGLSPQNPHYIPGYTGHCPLLRFSVGQTYGQVTGQLLRGPPGLAWPPAHRTLLPPIRSPRSPVISRRRPPPRRGHERLSSSVVPGYTGFIPQARFIFAKNCNQVWAEAMSDFTQRRGAQESPELQEAKGEEEVERDQGPEAEEPQLKHELAQVRWGRAGGAGLGARCLRGARILFFLSLTSHQTSPYSMDDTDPQKFFMSGESKWAVTEGVRRTPGSPDSASPSPAPRLHWLRAPCPLPLWFQLPCAHQPGAAGIWTDVLRGQGAEGPQTSFPTP